MKKCVEILIVFCEFVTSLTQHMTAMKKRVLMIANNTGAIGAMKDVELYTNFFLSLDGGAWDPSEILEPLVSPSSSELMSTLIALQAEKLDYLVVIFSGHGCLHNNMENTWLCLRGETLDTDTCILDSHLLGFAKKQLTILDCCRYREVEPQLLVECSKSASATPSWGQTMKIRLKYNAQIAKVPDGNCVVYACARTQEAMGEESMGGEFSCLMSNPSYLATQQDRSQYSLITVGAAFDMVHGILSQKNVFPELVVTDVGMSELPWLMIPEHF